MLDLRSMMLGEIIFGKSKPQPELSKEEQKLENKATGVILIVIIAAIALIFAFNGFNRPLGKYTQTTRIGVSPLTAFRIQTNTAMTVERYEVDSVYVAESDISSYAQVINTINYTANSEGVLSTNVSGTFAREADAVPFDTKMSTHIIKMTDKEGNEYFATSYENALDVIAHVEK